MAVSKKTRFEVFKRDKFTCQYCGQSAPIVVLQADHIQPKSKGGSDEILNLITSCVDCNQGKGARTLSDDSVLTKQKAQLELLQERREQLEMMMEWQKSLLSIEQDVILNLIEFWRELTPAIVDSGGFFDTTKFELDEEGLQFLAKWARKYNIAEITEAMKSACQYFAFENNEITKESWNTAFLYIPRICAVARNSVDKPYLKDLFYIRAILKNKFTISKLWRVLPLLERALANGASIEQLQADATYATTWTEFQGWMETIINGENTQS